MNIQTRAAAIGVATIAALAAIPPANAGTSNGPGMPSVPSTWDCRQYHRGPYTFHGVQSDACDGYFPGGDQFGGEVDAIVWNRHGVLKECRVQLNMIIHGRAYPMHGYRYTAKADTTGHTCDALKFWHVRPGNYNVTASYLSTGGVWYTTVQGPVVQHPGN